MLLFVVLGMHNGGGGGRALRVGQCPKILEWGHISASKLFFNGKMLTFLSYIHYLLLLFVVSGMHNGGGGGRALRVGQCPRITDWGHIFRLENVILFYIQQITYITTLLLTSK